MISITCKPIISANFVVTAPRGVTAKVFYLVLYLITLKTLSLSPCPAAAGNASNGKVSAYHFMVDKLYFLLINMPFSSKYSVHENELAVLNPKFVREG